MIGTEPACPPAPDAGWRPAGDRVPAKIQPRHQDRWAVVYVRQSTPRQVLAVVRLIFQTFDELGAVNAVLRHLVHQGIQLPVRPHAGPHRGQLEWHRPNRQTLRNLLHHPIYAGAYTWGRRAIDSRRQVPGRPGTGRTVLAMYHANIAGQTGPTLRDGRHWEPFRKGLRYKTKAICRVALDGRGCPAGYIVFHDEHLTATVIEAGYARRAVFPDLLRAAAGLAIGQRLERITLILPEDDPFIEFCIPLGLRKEVTYRSEGGGQVRMIRIPTALRKLADELAGRMAGAGELTIRTNLDDVHLAWRAGRLAVGPPRRGGPQARMPQWALAQMLYGYRGAEALAAEGTIQAPPQAVAALTTMFPLRPHFQPVVDHF